MPPRKFRDTWLVLRTEEIWQAGYASLCPDLDWYKYLETQRLFLQHHRHAFPDVMPFAQHDIDVSKAWFMKAYNASVAENPNKQPCPPRIL